MQRYTNAGQTMRAILALLAITGNLGKPGAGWVYANLATQIFGPVKDPLDCYPPEKAPMASCASPSAPPGWAGTCSPSGIRPCLRLGGAGQSSEPEPRDRAWCWRPSGRLDFRVVVDERLTDTAREADLVLPSKSLFEQSDVIGAYWHGYLQLRQKVIEPPGEVKPETEIYRALGRRLGMSEATLDGFLPKPGDAGVEAWLQARLDPFGITLDQLREGPVLAPGAEEVAFADGRFTTPSGRIELLSEEAAAPLGRGPAAALPGTPGVQRQRAGAVSRSSSSRRTPRTASTASS